MTCDRCGPQVRSRWAVWTFNGGLLYFCNHCYEKNAAALACYRATDLDAPVDGQRIGW